jgi:hypothetical protein
MLRRTDLHEAIDTEGGTVEEERKDLEEELQDEEAETEPHFMSSPSSVSFSPGERSSLADPSSSEFSSPSSS